MSYIYDDNMISTNEENGGVIGVSESSSSSFDNLSDLISHLPIIHVKKGLSKYYKGKSQSFTSLAEVITIKDLVKRRSRIKSCSRISGGILKQSRNSVYSLNATISMKSTKTSSSSHSNSRSNL